MKLGLNCELGGDLEAIRAFRKFGQLSPGSRYGMLHGALHAALAGYEEIPKDDLDAISYQAQVFLEEYADQLTEQEKWVLTQLQGCNNE